MPEGHYYIEPQIPGISIDLNSFAIFHKTNLCEDLIIYATAFSDLIELVTSWGINPCILGTKREGSSIYPSPAAQMLHIEKSTSLNYSVYSIDGQLQYEGTLSEYQNQIDVSGLSEGVYVLSLNGGLETFKFLVMRR